MDPSTYRRPGAFSPLPSAPVRSPALHQRSLSEESDSSVSSHFATSRKQPVQQAYPHTTRQQSVVAPLSNAASTVTPSTQNFSRPSISQASSDLPSRKTSPLIPNSELQRHKRQHSQGFFEPSLPTATLGDSSNMANLTASQIAAQAAMQHQSSGQPLRRRSQTVPSPQFSPDSTAARPKPPPLQTSADSVRKGSASGASVQQYHNGLIGGHTAAATAANAAFPRNAPLSPGLTSFEQPTEKEHKLKTERSRMKLFSKPKHIAISNSKEGERKDKALPSPNKLPSPGPSILSKNINVSTTSLIDPTGSSTPSLYSVQNSSTSTLIPADRQKGDDKERAHRHHFLSRQKNKLKERMEDHPIPLSSASSNSKPIDPNAPQSMYSFVPASPGLSTNSFAKSMSGLDLRHGGRALREKKKEEKASAAGSFAEVRKPDTDRIDWIPGAAPAVLGGHSFTGPSYLSGNLIFGAPSNSHVQDLPSQGALQGFGLTNMTPEDAWPFLKAKLLIIFENEELRMPIEDLNRLVSAYIQRCVQKKTPTSITEDVRDLFQTGFLSLEQTIRGIPDDRLIPYLVEMWLLVFGNILPYMQAVFLPLDLEFKGQGTIMTPREAAEFWGIIPDETDDAFGNALDIRRIILISFRDCVVLSRYDVLKSIFSRLSLDSINAGTDEARDSPDSEAHGRPSTAGSLDPGLASFNSQGTTLLSESSGARSRAVSNTSAPELPSFAPQLIRRQTITDSSQVTETVGRMLQCVSVLASARSGDAAQVKMEGLAKELKHNWLGRARTGRNRRGFVGTKIRPAGQGNRGHQNQRSIDSRVESML
ncbi:hypothetical protein MMC20_004003 [Loxospora ochrophaea]|nr:hypothetical protein [Loxospora ochrophaea]